jgi:hypothetical protein
MHKASAIACLLFLAVALPAAAQEYYPPPQTPPPPTPVPTPAPPMPPPTPPMPPPPRAWVPGPSAAQIDALEASGRRKKRVGAILMGTGGAIAVAGTALIIAGWWDDDGNCHRHYRGYYDGYYSDGYYSNSYYYGHCGDTALTIAGATTTLLGIGTIVPGIVLYINGGGDVDEARRLRRCVGVCWRPMINRGGAGVQLEMTR